MPNYPNSIYGPRAKANKVGVIYNPAQLTFIFSEDVVFLDDEVVALETELGLNPSAGYATVAERLDALSAGGASKGPNYWRHVGTVPFDRVYVAAASGAVTSFGVSAFLNSLRAFPFFSVRAGTIDRLCFRVTTAAAAGGLARMGIYQATGETNLYPNNLIVDTGTISTTTTGIKNFTVNVALAANTLYWFVINFGTAAPSILQFDAGSVFPVLGMSADLFTDNGVGWVVAQTFGALPDPFPAGGAGLLTTRIYQLACHFSA